MRRFLTNLLTCLLIHNSSVTAVYMEDISYMKCHIHHLLLDQYLSLKAIKISDIYVTIYVPPLYLRYISYDSKNNQHSMLSTPENKTIKFLFINITKKY